MLLLPGDIDDQSWNRGNYEGFLMCSRRMGFTARYRKNIAEADFEAVLRQYGDEQYDLILTAGTQFEEAVRTVAAEYPGTLFCVVNGRKKLGRNVLSVYPKEYEASHLAAVIGGNISETGIFGVIAGEPSLPMDELLGKYEEDVRDIYGKRTGKNAHVFRAYANSWEDTELGEEMAEVMFDKGVDTLFVYANKVGLGCIRAAKGKNVRVIGFSGSGELIDGETVVAAVEFDFASIYSWILKRYETGQWGGGQVYGIGIKEHIFYPVYAPGFSGEIKEQVEKEIKKWEKVN